MFTICQQDDEGGPWSIFNRLRTTHEELGELNDMMDGGITLAFMLRAGEWKGGQGKMTLGACCLPGSGSGPLQGLMLQLLEDTVGYAPDFVIVLSDDWWEHASEREREVLVFHELLHAGWARDQYGAPRTNRITGMPVPCIVPHDIEEFRSVVARYGAWKGDVADFLAAAAEHEARASAPPPPLGEDVF